MTRDLELEILEKTIETIWDRAIKLGVDPFLTHFEVVPANIMYEFGAYGIPGRFSHWTHGKAYYRMKTAYDYGLSKIYELVINTDPCYAFLMESNSLVQNKLIISHVLAHSDFFKHNVYFQPTYRQMIERVSVNAERIRRYEFEHGTLEVEKFLDAVIAVQEHIDPDVFIRARTEDREEESREPHRRETPYDDLWTIADEKPAEEEKPKPKKFPEEPQKDLLLFIMQNAHDLADWQQDIISIVRNEMLYFLPQMQTKIMNEGWATYWHTRIMRELDLTDDEYTEFASLHASVLAPSRRTINPYHVGVKIFEDIERRWDEPTEDERRRFGRKGGEGRQKILEVRELDNDMSFLRNYLTEKLVDDLDLYIYELRDNEWVVVEKNWEKVRDIILSSMTNFGNPYLVVEDGDYKRNGELYLMHSFEGRELDIPYAEKALQHVYTLWGRPVHLESVVDGKKVVLSYDGKENDKRTIT